MRGGSCRTRTDSGGREQLALMLESAMPSLELCEFCCLPKGSKKFPIPMAEDPHKTGFGCCSQSHSPWPFRTWRGPRGHCCRTACLGLLWRHNGEPPLFLEGILTDSILRTVTPPFTIPQLSLPGGPWACQALLLQELHGIPFRESSQHSEPVHGMQ